MRLIGTAVAAFFFDYTFMEASNIFPFAERVHFYIPLRRDLWEARESSIIYMGMSPWIYMLNIHDYLNVNGGIR